MVEQFHLRVAGRVQRQELHGLLQAPGVALAVVLMQAFGAGGRGESCGETRAVIGGGGARDGEAGAGARPAAHLCCASGS